MSCILARWKIAKHLKDANFISGGIKCNPMIEHSANMEE